MIGKCLAKGAALFQINGGTRTLFAKERSEVKSGAPAITGSAAFSCPKPANDPQRGFEPPSFRLAHERSIPAELLRAGRTPCSAMWLPATHECAPRTETDIATIVLCLNQRKRITSQKLSSRIVTMKRGHCLSSQLERRKDGEIALLSEWADERAGLLATIAEDAESLERLTTELAEVRAINKGAAKIHLDQYRELERLKAEQLTPEMARYALAEYGAVGEQIPLSEYSPEVWKATQLALRSLSQRND